MYQCNGGTEVVGWGENTFGQVNGKTRPKSFDKPHVLSCFSGKRIKGVYASDYKSLCFNDEGSVNKFVTFSQEI